jgi:GntR family transcriptional regulator/MocR family aminotransferase
MTKSRQSRINPCASILIDPDSARPAYTQVIDQIRSKVVNGQIVNGDRLPASRQFAASLGVSRRTIVTAYDNLIAEGILETRHGDGTYCAFDSHDSTHSSWPGTEQRLHSRAAQDGLEEAFSIMSLSPLELDPGALSLKAWSSASARAQRKLTASHLFDAVPGGLHSLKEGIARHLLSLRGLVVEPSQVIITAGIRESLDLVLGVIPNLRRIAVEDPASPRIRQLLQKSNDGAAVEFVTLPVDQAGANVEKLNGSRQVDAIHLTPSHQYPMGVSLSHQRRLEVIERVKESDCWILEDDYGAAVRYSGRNLKSLFELDSRKRTIYFGTLSNILFSNLHLSFMVVPEIQVERFVRVQERKRSLASVLAQAALAEFIECGAFAHHILELRKRGKANYSAMIAQVEEQLAPWLEPVPISGGMRFVALAKDPDFQDVEIAQAAKAVRLSPAPLSNLFISPDHRRPGLVFGFMGTAPDDAHDAIRRLRKVIKQFHD